MRKTSYSTVFDLDGMPPYSQFWSQSIARWQLRYRGESRRKCSCPSIANEKGTRIRSTLNLTQAVAREIANTICAEGIRIQISAPNEQTADALNAYMAEVLERNGFYGELGKLVEQAVAVGGGALSVWADGERNDDGEIVGEPRIRLRFYGANDFIPLKWSNSVIAEAVLISHEAKDGKYYTRLEFHRHEGKAYAIQNRLFVSPANAILGTECPLAELYANAITPEVRIEGQADGSLFSYFANTRKNNVDFNSPLGISLLSGSEDTLEALDTAFDSFGREFVLGKKRILVPSSCIRSVRDEQGQAHRYFDANDEAYEVLYADNPESLRIQDNTVSLRVDEHIKAINALLDILAFQTGLSQGSFSFDRSSGLKTATEIVSENAKTYRYVSRMRQAVAACVKRAVQGILSASVVYQAAWQGRTIASMLAGGFSVSVDFPDGIIQDDSERQRDGIALVNAGLISKRTFLVDYMRYTPEEAEAELERVKAETPAMPDMAGLLGA